MEKKMKEVLTFDSVEAYIELKREYDSLVERIAGAEECEAQGIGVQITEMGGELIAMEHELCFEFALQWIAAREVRWLCELKSKRMDKDEGTDQGISNEGSTPVQPLDKDSEDYYLKRREELTGTGKAAAKKVKNMSFSEVFEHGFRFTIGE